MYVCMYVCTYMCMCMCMWMCRLVSKLRPRTPFGSLHPEPVRQAYRLSIPGAWPDSGMVSRCSGGLTIVSRDAPEVSVPNPVEFLCLCLRSLVLSSSGVSQE